MFKYVSARALTQQTLTTTLNTYLRKLESWDQYGGMYVCMRASKCLDA